MAKSLQKMLDEKGLFFASVLASEEIIVHRMKGLKANCVDARIIISIEVDGTTYEFNDVRAFMLKKRRKRC